MGEITRQPARAIQNALIDSVLAGLCALIVFGPIVGVVLKGYGFTLAPARGGDSGGGGDGRQAGAQSAAAEPQGKSLLLPALRGRMTGYTSGRRATARGCAG